MSELLPLCAIHLHSSFSQFDGVASFTEYLRLAKEYNIKGLALTDHGTATGLFQFYKTLQGSEVKPIIGEEFYITTDTTKRVANRNREVIDRDRHLVVLVKNDIGYKNFCKLNYLSYVEGYYYKPRITFDQLFAHKEGLVVTNACAGGVIGQLIIGNLYQEAEDIFKRFVEEFREDFYGEIQFNELNEKGTFGFSQKEVNDFTLEMCKKYNVKTIIGSDSHYANKEDVKLQQILMACLQRKESGEESVDYFHAKHLYLHNSDDFFRFNKEFEYNYPEELLKQCFINSLEVCDKCTFEFDLGGAKFPKFILPKEYKTNKEYCEKLAFDGLLNLLKERQDNGETFTDEQIEKYENQLQFEIDIIDSKGFIDYFLIYQDLVKWAKNNGIGVGPGRGSAAGALISYSLLITTVDPVKHKLYFERFLNTERCLTTNNIILLKDGTSKKVEDITLTDEVQTSTGKGKLIKILENKVEKEVYTIETENGASVELTANHIVPVLRKGKQIEIRVDEVLETDFLFTL